MLEAVTFDAANTLLVPQPSAAAIYAAALSRRGRAVSAEEVEPVFRRAWRKAEQNLPPGHDRYAASPGGERGWWRVFLAAVVEGLAHDAPLDPVLDELIAAFTRPEAWRIEPDVRPTLAALGGRGLRLGVISNWDSRLRNLLTELDLASEFDTITVSFEETVEKPHPEIFTRTVARLGVAPGRTLHVGDSLRDDYQGALAAGLRARLLDRSGSVHDGVCTVASLLDLVDLVQREVTS